MRGPTLVLLVMGGLGCRKASAPDDVKVCPDTDIAEHTDEPVEKSVGPVADDDFSGLAELPCGQGIQCADGDALLGDTCCAWGDSLEVAGSTYFNEAVDLETDGRFVTLCGGFGPAWADMDSGSLQMNDIQSIPRCQRMVFGPTVGDDPIVYFAHHGDDWVPTPELTAYRLGSQPGEVQSLTEGLLYEGMATTETHLFAATHATGLGSYAIDSDGSLSALQLLGGFDNATHVEVSEGLAYVTDERQLRVVDVSDPSDMSIVETVQLGGKPRNLDVVGDRIYLALGNDGVEIYNRNTLALEGVLEPDGSVQDVAVENGLVAMANWTHVSLWDEATGTQLGSQRVKDRFEQDLGVNFVDGRIYVAEWQGLTLLDYRQGRVAPDLWVPDEMYVFDGDREGEWIVEVENRGPLDLALSDIEVTDERFSVDAPDQVVRAGERTTFPLAFTPPGDHEAHALRLCSNDPDDTVVDVPIFSGTNANRLNVGDKLTSDFAFLDPTGNNDLSQLEGNVLVLAYFALF